MNKLRKLKQQMKEERESNKKSFTVYMILRILVILVMILQFLNKNYENVFLCLLTLLLFIVPSFLQVEFKIELPTALEIIILLFIFSAEILGEIHSFYIRIPYWDTILHTLNGFLAAAIGFSLVDLLNQRESKHIIFKLSPLFMALVAFCFSMTIGVMWEFFEFSMDTFFNLDMQKDTIIHSINSVLLDPTRNNIPISITDIKDITIQGYNLGIGGYIDIGLIDTMEDLFVNFIGASIFSVIGYFYVKNRNKTSILKWFIPKVKNNK